MKERGKDSTPSGNITVSYGGCFMGYAYGSGYGKEITVTKHADKIALRLHKRLGLDIVKRGNADGRSCGAHYNGDYAFGCSARMKTDNTMAFSAYYETDDEAVLQQNYLEANPNTGNIFRSCFEKGHIIVRSVRFKTAGEAIAWLISNGSKHCPSIKGSAHGKKR